MKKGRFSLFPAALLIIAFACQNPLKDIALGFKDPIEHGVVEIRFRSLKGPIPKTVSLDIAGPDADQVVTTLNTTSYKVNDDGVLLLAASPEADFSNTDPFRFTVAAKADGYLNIIQPVQFADTGRHTLSPGWVKLNDPPSHMSASQVGEIATPLAGELSVSTPVVNQKKDNATVAIAAGSEFKAADGSSLTGPFTTALVHVENRGNNPADYLPNRSVMPAVTGLSGGSLGSLQLDQVAGTFSMEFYNNSYQIAQLISKPALMTLSLNPETIDPAEGRAIQAGDQLPFYRYDRFSNRWYQEKSVAISRNGSTGQLQCSFSTTHPGLWVAGWTQAVCDEGPIFAVNSPLPAVDIQFLCKVVDADTRRELSTFYSSLANGSRITLMHLPQNRRIRLQIFNFNNAYSTGNPGQPILETAPQLTCNETPQPLDLQRMPIPPALTVRFDFACPPPTKLKESMLPTRVRLQYSESGQRNWRDLVTLNRSDLQALTYKLQVNKPYDIRVSTDGGASWPLEKTRFVPNNNTLAFELASPEFCVY